MVTPTVDSCLPLYGGQFSPEEILSRLANGLGQTLGARWFRVWSLVLGLAGCYRPTASHTFHAFGRTWEYSGARSPMGGGVRTLADREDPARVTDWSFRKSGQGESIIELTVMNLVHWTVKIKSELS